jgi:hypothetical protein
VLPAYLYLAAVGSALALIDLDCKRLPDALTLPSYPVAAVLLAGAALLGSDTGDLLRAVLGGLAMGAVYFGALVRLSGRHGVRRRQAGRRARPLHGLAGLGRLGGGPVPRLPARRRLRDRPDRREEGRPQDACPSGRLLLGVLDRHPGRARSWLRATWT